MQFKTDEGGPLGELMLLQAQEMAKELKRGEGRGNKGGWTSQVYEVKVYTSDVRGAGTDAKVHLQIHGTKGSTTKMELPGRTKRPNRPAFERKQVDTFTFRCVPHGTDESGELGVDYFWLPPDVMDIGVQQRLTVGHNGANLGAGWHLAKVTVQNMRTHFKLEYVANRWLDKAEGDCKIQITVPNDWGKVVSPIKNTLELLAIEKEDVVGTFRALGKAKLTSKLDGGDKICTLEDGDIVECFEQGTNEAGKDRIRILSPANEMGWASLISSTDKKLFKTTRSWGAFRPNVDASTSPPQPTNDGCSGWMEKKGGMRTNWNKRWFHLKGIDLKYYETNKGGVGESEKGFIDVRTIVEVRQSTAPGASEFELEIVSEGRTFRFRTFNKPELSHWLTMLSKFAYTD